MQNNFFLSPKSISPKNPKNGFDFTYIISHDDLMAWETKVCCELKHSITVIEFVKDERFGMNQRTDSDTIYFSMRPSCEALRMCARSEMCRACDDHHAELFMNLKKHEIETKLEKRIKTLKPLPFFSRHYREPKLLQNKNGRYYLEYYCPMLGYKEYVFPIIFGDDILGVLFMGQVKVKDDGMHQLIREDFWQNQNGCFDEYVRENPDWTKEDIYKKLAPPSPDSHDSHENRELPNTFKEPIGLPSQIRRGEIPPEDVTRLIHETCMCLEDFEQLLNDKQEERRVKYFKSILRDAENDFHKSFPPLSDIDIRQMKLIKKNFDKFLQTISEKLGLVSVSVFAEKMEPGPNGKDLELYSRGGVFDRYNDFTKMKFAPDKVNAADINPFSPLSSMRQDDLFDGFSPDKIDKQNKVLLVHTSWAVLFVVKDLTAPGMNELYKLLFDTISPFFTNIFMAIFTLKTAFLNEKFDLTLHMYKHECTHIADAMADRNENFFRTLNRTPEPKKLESVCNDMQTNIFLIKNMAAIIGTIVGTTGRDAEIVMEDISIFKELLYKWDKTFENRIAEQNLSIIVPPVRALDDDRPYSVRTDKKFLEVIVYNIIDNAIKYCHWGTNLYADFRQIIPGSSSCVLTVVDFGHGIEPGDKPYEMYYRQNTHYENKIHGDGLGLYAVKRIADILDIRVSHSCIHVSDYNVSLIPEYLSRDLSPYTKDWDLCVKLQEELERLKPLKLNDLKRPKQVGLESLGDLKFTKLLDLIINKQKKKPVSNIDLAKKALLSDITKPTYCVWFAVEISLL